MRFCFSILFIKIIWNLNVKVLLNKDLKKKKKSFQHNYQGMNILNVVSRGGTGSYTNKGLAHTGNQRQNCKSFINTYSLTHI